MAHKIKTEHAGAKKGGSGFYGHHAEAKKVCKTKRRIADKKEIQQGIRLGEDRPRAYLLRQIEEKREDARRLLGIKSETYVAIPFGNDGFDGDSGFYPTDQEDVSGGPIPATLRSTFKQLKRAFFEKCEVEVGLDTGDIEDPSGFWILTPENLELAMLPSNVAGSAGNDGECYMLNSITKRMCHKLATKVVGDKSVLEGP